MEESKAPEDQHVPYARFVKVNEKRAELEARVAELEAEAQRWQERAATADTLAQQLETARAAESASRAQFAEYQAAAALGVSDPELYDAARWSYGRLPEDGRPAFADALKGWKDDPSTAPVVLRPHLQPAQAPPPAPVQPTTRAPDPNAQAAPYQQAPATLDPATMTLEQYRAHRDQFRGKSLL